MNPAQPDPAELLLRVRQQLILAQVRIMELEDARDETAARLEDVSRLLKDAQSLTDQKLAEAAHAERLRADCETQFGHLQRLHRENLTALESARGQLAELHQKHEAELRDAVLRDQRNKQLETELRLMKSSFSWRCTAWLRALGGSAKKP